MSWIRKMAKIFRITILSLIALMGLSSFALALEQWEKDINALLLERKFDDAFELINQQEINNIPSIYQYKGLLLGSGVLSSGKDLCGAVINLEKAYVDRKFLYKDLNFLYGGDWAGIAAIEGNREALFDVGDRIRFTEKSMALVLFYDDALGIKESHIYYFNAAELGHEEAKKVLAIRKWKYPNIDFSKFEKKMQFKEIYCPVRNYQNTE